MPLLWKKRYAVVVAGALLTSSLSPSFSFSILRAPISRNRHVALLSIQQQEQEECSLEGEGASACLESTGFVEQPESSFMSITKVFVAEVESLRDSFPSYEDPSDTSEGSNVIKYHKRQKRGRHHLHCKEEMCQDENTHVANMEYNKLVGDNDVVLVDTVRKPGMSSISRAFMSAGPRRHLHFNPSTVNAAIVTCGGLCPGLNNVIRELVHSLYYLYGAKNVWGVKGGFNGFNDNGNPDYDPVLLTNEMVESIHHEGGTILRSSRGGFDIDKIITFLQKHDICQLYVIGGDGTHRGAYAIHQACMERSLNIAVAGIPKVSDCDWLRVDLTVSNF